MRAKLIAILLLCNTAARAGAPVAINPMDYGVSCNGVSDDTVALQNAEVAAEAGHLPLFLPDGCGTTGLNTNASVAIVGSGGTAGFGAIDGFTNLGTSSVTRLRLLGQTGISVGTGAIVLVGIRLVATVPGQIGMTISAPGPENEGSIVRDVYFDNERIGLEALNASNWLVDHCFFIGADMKIGIAIEDVTIPDSGYSNIRNSTFITQLGGHDTNAIIQYSSGGLSITDSKFNGWTWAYQLYLGSGVHTANLMASNNQFEHLTAGAFTFWRQGATGSFGAVTLTGNLLTTSPWFALMLDDGRWMSQVNISGCNGCAGRISLPGVANVSMSGIN